jgi:phage anti-repressor protein
MSKITLKEFLKQFTAIPEKFINEYYEFYELCENNKFGIHIKIVLKYLDLTDLHKLEEKIRKLYILNSDYVIIRISQKSTKGIKDANYMLSFECFEKICMNSNTEKGKMFRDYFVMLRKFIDYYKNYIADKIMELTKTNKYIYILTVNKKNNILKLGRTGNIQHRLQSYATGKDTHPDVKFIMVVEDDKRVENCAKAFTKVFQYKGNKELYKMHNDNLKEIIFDCAKTDKKIQKLIENNNNLDTYVVYDDSKKIEYLNLNDEVIGMEKTSNTKKHKILNYENKIRNKKSNKPKK